MTDSIEELVAALARELQSSSPLRAQRPIDQPKAESEKSSVGTYTVADYPMLEKHRAEIRTPTGKTLDDLTLENVLNEKISIQDVRISREMLYAQADIAKSAGKPAMGDNLKRAAELIRVPDSEVIAMYNLLRPNRATGTQLEELATKLQTQYDAPMCAKLVREAEEVYEKRGLLLK